MAVELALAKRGPTLGVVVVQVIGVNGGGGNVVLQCAKVGKHLGDSSFAVFVDWWWLSRLVGVIYNCLFHPLRPTLPKHSGEETGVRGHGEDATYVRPL